MNKVLSLFLISSCLAFSIAYAEKSKAKVEIEKKQAEEKKLEFKPFVKEETEEEKKIRLKEESARKDEFIPFKDSPEAIDPEA